MTETGEQLKAALLQLPASERAALAHLLIDSLDGGADADAEAAWDAELARRMAEIQSGQAVGEPAERQPAARLLEKAPEGAKSMREDSGGTP